MTRLDIERVGGMAGFGGPNLKSTGQIASAKLAPADRAAVEALFANPPAEAAGPDEFSYRLTRQTPSGPETIQVPERHVPAAVRSTVKDELR
jgi:hypothetical protein